MATALTPEIEKLVAKKVASGLYASGTEVIEVALALLEERDHDRARRLEALREKVAVGIAEAQAGLSREVPLDELLRRAREQHNA
jgi:antitoxin ParD1/3/4